ncbi:MAG: hypothetical protein A4E55_02332 [Pelotomaculum sp. PtaU1.Bin035]|nr:MAG: hypothetical protein A4E55_02332 [Pelotomaculum sp. PtaU1.Bin035]
MRFGYCQRGMPMKNNIKSNIIEQLINEVSKNKKKIDVLKYGQVIFVIHEGNITRGQIIENFEPADKPDSGRLKP